MKPFSDKESSEEDLGNSGRRRIGTAATVPTIANFTSTSVVYAPDSIPKRTRFATISVYNSPIPIPSIIPKMKYHTKELFNIDLLPRNTQGLFILGSVIVIALASDITIVGLMYRYGVLGNPYMWAAVLINILTLIMSMVSLFNRHLYYTPLLMSTTTAICMTSTIMTFYRYGNDFIFIASIVNVTLMLILWTAYATTIKSAPAPWLHPFLCPDDIRPKEDLVMSEITDALERSNMNKV